MSDAYAAWKAAEAALGRPGELERAAAPLPNRAAWLLRAIAALDDGRVDEVRRVSAGLVKAGHVDLAAILEVLLQPAAELDPSSVRKQAKAAGFDAYTKLPFLDLLRSLVAFRAGAGGQGSKALRIAARHRPALDAAQHVLTTTSSKTFRYPALERDLPRAGQVAVMTKSVSEGHRPTKASMAALGPLLVDLSPERWPDLHGGPAEQILRRLAGDEPWTDPHDAASSWLYSRPADERLGWLGAIVRTIGRLLADGLGATLRTAVHVARHLAHDAGLRDLHGQLGALDLRLDWLDFDEPSPRTLALLWADRRRLAPAERLDLGRKILDTPSRELSGTTQAQAVVAVAAGTDLGPALAALVEREMGQLDGTTLRQLLRSEQVEPARGRVLLAMHGAVDGQALNVLRDLPAWAPSDPLGAAAVAAMVASGVSRPPRHHLRKLLDAAAVALASAPIEAAWGLISLVYLLESVPPAVRATLARWAAAPPTDPLVKGPLLALLALTSSLGVDDELLKALLIEEGRTLRRALDADLRALTLIGAALASAPEPIHDTCQAGLQPLTAFLLRHDPDRLVPLLDRVPPAAVVGIHVWFAAQGHILGKSERWERWSDENAGGFELPDALPSFEDMLESLRSSGVRPEDLLRSVISPGGAGLEW